MSTGWYTRWLLATALLLPVVSPAFADEPLPSRDLVLAPFALQDAGAASFDLMDFRTDERAQVNRLTDSARHSIFVAKHYVGAAAGYDNGIAHGSVGLYLTVAEWGRWNFGVPGIELGVGRYRVYDSKHQQTVMKQEATLIVSLVSVHYRLGYLRSFGVNWYLNLEKVYDLRNNLPGSQFGLSFSRK